MRRNLRIRRPEDLYRPSADHPVETIANLDAIPIAENGEPLVDLRQVCTGLRFVEGKSLLARRSVAERLNEAQQRLATRHPGYRIRVGDAYRDPGKQARFYRVMYGVVRLLRPFWSKELAREAAGKYVAAPDALAPPPHTTGGAVDVRLVRPDGKLADMGPWRLAATRADYTGLTEAARQNRERLCDAMTHAGFSNYEEEWWHWSYGDSGWALRTGQPAALYGPAVH